ncbi:MAG: hypothetical protein QW728_00160 [Thermoplasmata archaeon]
MDIIYEVSSMMISGVNLQLLLTGSFAQAQSLDIQENTSVFVVKKNLTEELYKIAVRQMKDLQKSLGSIMMVPVFLTALMFIAVNYGALDTSETIFQIAFWLVFAAVIILVIAVFGVGASVFTARKNLNKLLDLGEVMEAEGLPVLDKGFREKNKNKDIWQMGNLKIECDKVLSEGIEMALKMSGRAIRVQWDPITFRIIAINEVEVKGSGMIKTA